MATRKTYSIEVGRAFDWKAIAAATGQKDQSKIQYDPGTRMLTVEGVTKTKLENAYREYMDSINKPRLDSLRVSKIDQMKYEANKAILDKWPLFKQINCLNGVYTEEVKQQMIQDINDIRKHCDNKEEQINKCENVEELKLIKFIDTENK